MKLVQGFSTIETALAKAEETLASVMDRPTTDDGFSVVTAAELETFNSSIRSSKELMKAVKDLSRDRVSDSLRQQELLVAILENQTNAYAYATSTYSSTALASLDEYTSASLKRILRDHFAKIGLSYEGWN